MKRLFRLGFLSALVAPLMALAFISGPAYTATTGCQSAAPAPTDTYPGNPVVVDNFESGTLGKPLVVTTAGTGTATVSSTLAHTGTCAAYLHATIDAGSISNFSVPLPIGSQNQVYADAWFNITMAGVTGNNVPYFRIFSGSTRIMDVFRDNTTGDLVLRVTSPTGLFSYTTLAPTVPLNSWHHLVMHVIPGGAATTVEVWLDGKSVLSSNKEIIGATAVTGVQLGSEHEMQKGDIYLDDLIVNGGTGTPTPTPTPVPPASSNGLNDYNGDGKNDLIARDTGGELWLYPGTGTGDWSKRIGLGSGWNVMTSLTRAGDFNGDGKADIIARDKSGELWLYPGTGTGSWTQRQPLGPGWNVMTSIVGCGDFNGDGKSDLIARDSSGELWLYPNNGAGDWFKRVDLGSGWNVMTSIVAPGDFNADGKADLIGRDTSGQLWLYPGNGKDGWSTRVSLGAGWNVMSSMAATGDMNSDAKPDVIARDTTGELWLYPNNGVGDWFKRIDLGAGWNTLTSIL